MRKLNSIDDFNTGITSGMVLVYFYADWCGPCRMIGPILDNLLAKYKDKVEFLKVNVDELQDLTANYNIQTIPTVIIFKNGNTVTEFYGPHDKDFIVGKIDGVI
jgi:thioredoxin 1